MRLRRPPLWTRLLFWCAHLFFFVCAGLASAQPHQPHPNGPPTSAAFFHSANLPTDRFLDGDRELPSYSLNAATPDVNHPVSPANPPIDFKNLLRPRVRLTADWEPVTDGLGLQSYDTSITMPTYPFFGPPPPLITAGYSFTEFDTPTSVDVPSSLHDFSLGVAWIRRINQQWTTRWTIAGAFASDLENTTSDAWQLRAGAFAMYQPNERWSFAFGVLVTGREDLPVLPGVGLVWNAVRGLRLDLMMPRPRVSFLLAETSERQHWGYLGAALSGGAWAFVRNDTGRSTDQLNYREFRLVVGWESTPPRPPGSFVPTGTTFNLEAGYVLGREFEFNRDADISFDGAFLLRTSVRF